MKLLPHLNNKGNFNELAVQGTALLVFIVVLGTVALTASMFNEVGGQVAFEQGDINGTCDAISGGDGTRVCNASFVGVVASGIAGVSLFGDFTELIALVIIAAVILGLLTLFRGSRR